MTHNLYYPQKESWQRFSQNLAEKLQTILQTKFSGIEEQLGFKLKFNIKLKQNILPASLDDEQNCIESFSTLDTDVTLVIAVEDDGMEEMWYLGQLMQLNQQGYWVYNGNYYHLNQALFLNNLEELKVLRIEDILNNALMAWTKLVFEGVKKTNSRMNVSQFIEQLKWHNQVGNQSLFSRILETCISQNPLLQYLPELANPMLKYELTQRVVITGAIQDSHRAFKPYYIGRICPLNTPQTDQVGLVQTLASGARINEEGFIVLQVIDCNEGETHWLSVKEQSKSWIAYENPQKHKSGSMIPAFNKETISQNISVDQASYYVAEEDQLFGIIANMIPYRQYNDPTRGTMACAFLRQALPLVNGSEPKTNPKKFQKFCTEEHYGTELLTAYMPWYGWNFEDAVVISRSASKQLSSSHKSHYRFILQRDWVDQEIQILGNSLYFDYFGINLNNYDKCGIIKPGVRVKANQPLIIETIGNEQQQPNFIVLPENECGGIVQSVRQAEWLDKDQQRAVSIITIQEIKPAQVGDKLTNRHGQKGVISRISADHEMPYIIIDKQKTIDCECGENRLHEHMQLLINPLSVFSRFNIGQLKETLDGRQGSLLEGLPECLPCYTWHKKDQLKCFKHPVFTGYQYQMKLDHNASDKWNARNGGSNASLTQNLLQPMRGRKHQGGQRIGEMETWALAAHNASALLQEMMTLKSDNPEQRTSVIVELSFEQHLLNIEQQLPESFYALTAYLNGIGIDIEQQGKESLFSTANQDQQKIAGLKITNLDEKSYKKLAAENIIETPLIKETSSKTNQFHAKGLHSTAIFNTLQQTIAGQRAYTPLAEKIINPLKLNALIVEKKWPFVIGQLIFSNAVIVGNSNKQLINWRSFFNQYQQAIFEALPETVKHYKADSNKESLKEAVNSFRQSLALQHIDLRLLLWETLEQLPEIAAIKMELLTVLPARLRPYREEENGKRQINDTDKLYQQVLRCNIKLLESLKTDNEDEIIETRIKLFHSIAQLMINEKLPNTLQRKNQKTGLPLKSLCRHVDGKKGIILSNILGKRVDFSARAVITPNPLLDVDQCRISWDIALQLYKFPLLKRLSDKQNRESYGQAVQGDQTARKQIQKDLEQLMAQSPILLNRQPSLHRLSVLAFWPQLTEHQVIEIPPQVTAGYNADFDGDQMAIYLPLSQKAIVEAKKMFPSQHLWHPANGHYALSLTQDLALGHYQNTRENKTVWQESLESESKVNCLNRQKIESQQAFQSVTENSFSLGPENLLNTDEFKELVLSQARGDEETVKTLQRYTHGLTIAEFIKEAKQARDKQISTKISTGKGGALTKKLIHWANSLHIIAGDCGSRKGVTVTLTKETAPELIKLQIYGRILAKEYQKWPKGTVINRLLVDKIYQETMTANQKIELRSPLNCQCIKHVCQQCYGLDWGQGLNQKDDVPILIKPGMPVGIIAAQAIGEPGTQLALNSKHQNSSSDDMLKEILKLFKEKASPVTTETLLNHYLSIPMEVAAIHFEIIYRAKQQIDPEWIADLADKAGLTTRWSTFNNDLVTAAKQQRVDHLTDLKSRTLLGLSFSTFTAGTKK